MTAPDLVGREPNRMALVFAGGGGLVLLAVLFQNVANFGFHIAAARIVGVAPYGALGILLALTLALTIPLTALQTAVNRSVSESGEQSDPRVLLRRTALWAVVFVVFFACLAPLINSFLAIGSINATLFIGPCIGVAAVGAVTRGVAIGRKRFKIAALSIAAAVTARFTVGIWLVAVFGINGAMLATVLAEMVGVAVAWQATYTERPTSRVRTTWSTVSETFSMTLGIWLLGSVDLFVAGHYLLGRERAGYVAAGTAARAILVFPQVVAMLALPRFVSVLSERDNDPSETNSTAVWLTLRNTLLFGSTLAIAAATAVAVGGKYLLPIAFGVGFTEAGNVLVICAFATIPVSIAAILATFHLARHSRLALLPWIGVFAEVAATFFWHSSAEQLAKAAMAGVSIQLVVSAIAITRERTRQLRVESGDLDSAAELSSSTSEDVTGKRILVVAWRDLHHPAAGGSEVYVEEIARRWVTAGHSVTLFCASVQGRPDREFVHGVEIVRAGSRLTVYRQARRFVAAEHQRFDVIVECVNTKPFDSMRVAGSTPVVALIHQVAREVWWYEVPFPAAALGRFVLEPRWLRRYRDIPTLTVSASSRESLLSYGLHDVTVVPEGVTPPDPLLSRIKATSPTLVFCGRLVKSKRPDHAIEAFGKLKHRFPDLRMLIIGSGPMEGRLGRSAPEGCDLLGRLSEVAKQEALASAHALVVTSVREGWGLVVSEAAAVGTPTVGYDVAGLRDSIAAAGGLTCQPDPAAMADLLADVLPGLVDSPPEPIDFGGAMSWDKTASAVIDAVLVSVANQRDRRQSHGEMLEQTPSFEIIAQ